MDATTALSRSPNLSQAPSEESAASSSRCSPATSTEDMQIVRVEFQGVAEDGVCVVCLLHSQSKCILGRLVHGFPAAALM